MAEPKTEIEERLDQLEIRIGRLDLAICTMATWLVQAQTGFGTKDALGIERIVRGETPRAGE
jgi:hypothetical protein